MSGSEGGLLVGALVAMWVVQILLAHRQAIAVTRRIAEMRRRGTVAVGMGRARLRGRTYAIVSVDREDRVIDAQVLRGWSLFAEPRPIPGLAGQSLFMLDDERIAPSKDPALRAAINQALTTLRQARAESATREGGAAIAEHS